MLNLKRIGIKKKDEERGINIERIRVIEKVMNGNKRREIIIKRRI